MKNIKQPHIFYVDLKPWHLAYGHLGSQWLPQDATKIQCHHSRCKAAGGLHRIRYTTDSDYHRSVTAQPFINLFSHVSTRKSVAHMSNIHIKYRLDTGFLSALSRRNVLLEISGPQVHGDTYGDIPTECCSEQSGRNLLCFRNAYFLRRQGDGLHIWNVGQFLPGYTAQHSRGVSSPMWQYFPAHWVLWLWSVSWAMSIGLHKGRVFLRDMSRDVSMKTLCHWAT
jgi:hypothetical protein